MGKINYVIKIFQKFMCRIKLIGQFQNARSINSEKVEHDKSFFFKNMWSVMFSAWLAPVRLTYLSTELLLCYVFMMTIIIILSFISWPLGQSYLHPMVYQPLFLLHLLRCNIYHCKLLIEVIMIFSSLRCTWFSFI